MAVATLYETDFSSPQGNVQMVITYDTVSLVVQELSYTNPSPLPGTLTMSGPVVESISMPSTDGITVNVSLVSADIVCVQQQITLHGVPRTVTQLPGGESVQFIWPT